MELDINAYLSGLLLKYNTYQPSKSEVKEIEKDLVGFILRKIIRKKFRKGKLYPNTQKTIYEKVSFRVKKNLPIDFVSPIVASYHAGVLLEYISEDLILTRMNNYPQASLEQYSKSFSKLLNLYAKNTPKNLQFNYFRIGDRYDKNTIIKRVEELLPERRKDFEKLSPEEKERELNRSHRSVFYNGEKDLTQLKDKDRLERIIESRLIELAYYKIEGQSEFLSDYLYGDGHICICFSFGLSHDNIDNDLTLGSTYSSIVDYWIGRGILEKNSEKFIPRIVSN